MLTAKAASVSVAAVYDHCLRPEIFYVALPEPEERKKIFEIHLKKRRPGDAPNIDTDALAAETDGYSGADIEGVVAESVESAFVKGSAELTDNDVLTCIKNTNSLSVIMKDELEEMDKLYKEKKLKKASR